MAIQANKVLNELQMIGVNFIASTGTPTLTAKAGTLYMKTDTTAATGRLFINTDGGTTWAVVTSA